MSALLAGAPVFESAAKTAYVTARAVEYAGTAVFYGGLLFVGLLWPDGAATPAVRRLLGGAWFVGAGATIAALDLEAAWARDGSAGDLVDPHALPGLLATDFGREWAAMALLWLLAAVVVADLLRRGAAAARSLAWRVGALSVGLGTLRVFGLTGHARETAHPVLAQIADVVHLAGMATWIGGLAVLGVALLPRRDSAALEQVLPRYSTTALCCVVAILSSGAVLAWNLLGGLHDLVSTTYGHVLLVKLGLLALVLAAAGGSKTWVQHRLDFAVLLRGESGTGIRLLRPLALSVAAETALLLGVLAVASVLVTADPGR
jgi:copper transport protein